MLIPHVLQVTISNHKYITFLPRNNPTVLCISPAIIYVKTYTITWIICSCYIRGCEILLMTNQMKLATDHNGGFFSFEKQNWTSFESSHCDFCKHASKRIWIKPVEKSDSPQKIYYSVDWVIIPSLFRVIILPQVDVIFIFPKNSNLFKITVQVGLQI